MKNYSVMIFILMIFLSFQVYAGHQVRGVVKEFYIGEKYNISPTNVTTTVRFRFDVEETTDGSTPCIDDQLDRYYMIELDETSVTPNKHTAFYFFYQLITYSHQFKKPLTIYLGANTPMAICAAGDNEVPLYYMFMDF